MRITIATIGSTGDVLPYLGLGQHLAEHGHVVTVATHRSHHRAVSDAGLTPFLLPVEPRQLLTPEVVEELRLGGTRAAKAVAGAFLPYGWDLAVAVDEACRKADLALLSPMAWTGRHSAEGLGIPSMGVHLQPLEPTRAFPPPTLTTRSLGGPLNAALGRKVQTMMVKPYLSVVNDLRAEHGLPRTTVRAHLESGRDWPVLHGFSDQVVPRPRDWRSALTVTGYWWPPLPRDWTPDPDLVDFLESGPTPVFIGFGSTSPMDPEELGGLVTRVTARMRVRAVVQTGWAGVAPAAGHVLHVGPVPHQWLFPRVRAVVHHGGAGTTAAALRAGVPSVTVPVSLDQPFWARRLHDLGVGARPVPARHLNDHSLERGLAEVLGNDALTRNAARLGGVVAAERGAAVARRHIEAYAG